MRLLRLWPMALTRFSRAMRGVRMRSALAAVVVVAAALAVSFTLLFVLLQRTLLGSVESSARLRAADVARQVTTEPIAAVATDLQGAAPRQFVQVIDADGRVVASSRGRSATAVLGDLRPQPGQTAVRAQTRLPLLDPDERYLVVAEGILVGSQPHVVLVAASVDAQLETIATVVLFLGVGYPLLLIVVGGATFLFVGRSMRPVERIRRRVAGIGASQLTERVPVPDSDDEVARLATTMNAMLDRLQSAHDSQRRFVADASHELRSPLAMLRAALDVAVADVGATSWRDLSGSMDAEAERMSHLVDDLLLLAKADESGLRLSVTEVDLDDLITAEVRRLRTGTSLQVEAHVVPVRVVGDPARLAQAIRNLTDNAARFAHVRVQLHLRSDGGAACVMVDDDGPGIPGGERERVFDRFVRLDASRDRSSGGSGLGLAIVKTIVSGHAGTVSAADSPLGGARLTLTLPLEPPVGSAAAD